MATPDGQNGSGGAPDRLGMRMPVGARSRNPEAKMPLLAHINELRNRLFKAALALAIASVAGWFLYPYVWHFIEAPYCQIPIKNSLEPKGHCSLYVTGLFDAFFLRIQLSIVIGAVISSPIWLYQIWAFVAPGLYKRERRWAYFFGGTALPLFAIGGTIAYFVMTRGLHFLLYLVPQHVTPIITISTYLSYAEMMLVIFGLAFEIPLVVVLLNMAGVLTHQRFRKFRRVIIFLVFAFAAVFVPSPDPISMLLLALPCVALVELAEVFAWVNDRRRARRGPVYPGLTPEEAAAYGLGQESGEASAVDASADPGER